MPLLNATQVAQVAYDAGWRSIQDVATAVSIAKVESDWNSTARYVGPRDDSYGLWQVNMLGSLGPARRAQFGLKADAELLDPAVNGKAAFAIFTSAKGNWSGPWKGTYKSIKYLAVYNEATQAATNVVAGRSGTGNPLDRLPDLTPSLPDLPSLPNPFGAAAGFVKALTDRATILRALKVVAGLAVAALGLIVIFRDSLTSAALVAVAGPAGAAVGAR